MRDPESHSESAGHGALPKVLLCTFEIPQSINAGSMQLLRAFQEYPVQSLYVLGPKPAAGARLLDCPYETRRLLTYRLACTRFRRLAIGLNAFNRWWEPQLAQSVAAVRRFQPDLVLTVMDKLSYYKHAWALARRTGTPLITVSMDDPETFEQPHPWLRGSVESLLRRVYADAALSLGVSREMCAYLEARFGRKSVVHYFGPPDGLMPRAAAESRLLRGAGMTVGYAGSLSLGYREGLNAILGELERHGATLNLYTRDQHNLPDHPRLRNRGGFTPEDLWPAVQRECDVVVLPYALEGSILKVYRTHFPTKLSEYCAVGMPILINGPEDATGFRWGRDHPEAALVSSGSDAFGENLRRLISSPELRASLAAGAVQAAEAEFDPEAARVRFRSLLSQAAFDGVASNALP